MNGPDNGGGKLRYDLIPATALRGVAAVLTLGAQKHGDPGGRPNWERGLSFQSHYGAIQRHLNAWQGGEDFDPEGFHHLAAAAANCMILLDMAIRHAGTEHDDRPDPIPDRCPRRPTS